jgi:hypothetical protein
MIAGMFAGWEEVIGIEIDMDHARCARRRLRYWSRKIG